MLDIKFIEEKPEVIKKTLKERGMSELIKEFSNFIKIRKDWKKNKTELDGLRHKRNIISLEINKAVKQKKDIKKFKREAKKISDSITKIENKIKTVEKKLYEMLLQFPNLIDPNLPKKEKIISTYGKTKKEKWQKDYLELAKNFDLIDFDSAIKMSGEGFYALKGEGAILQRALINFCLDIAKKNGYKEILLPVLLNKNSLINSGHLPKFKESMYLTQDGFYLSPTEEAGLLNLYANQTPTKLPINLTAYIPSFRTEKGATKGMIRTHQFDEVEVFKITKPSESNKELQKMIKDASQILKLLKLPFRIKLLPAWDIAAQSSITYDIDVFSSKTGWLEISSCSNCLDYQARRAKIYYSEKGKRNFVHTLNGTALGLGRVFIALIENNQQKDGSINIPNVLQKYCGFKKIEAKKSKKKPKKKKR
jgi:seryl-tRNA synthetase